MSSIKLPISMDDDGDLHEQILHIEAHIEELTDIARWWGRWRCLFAWRGAACQCAVRNLRCRRVERHSLLRRQIEVQHPQRLAVLNPETGRAELHWRDSDAVSEASHPWSGPCLLPIHINSAGRTDR
jgi:hypothetical protein